MTPHRLTHDDGDVTVLQVPQVPQVATKSFSDEFL